MKEKINVAELLKDCPKGMELDCTMFEGVFLERVDENVEYPIAIRVGKTDVKHLTKEGCWNKYSNAKCVIFPKGKTTWEGFHIPFKDGDIVTWKDRGSLVAFIYKERKNVAVVKHHFALYTGGFGALTDGEISLVESEIVFATEEEKEKLFDAIKAKGYKWNSEAKTLEKLIQPKFKVGDKVRHKNNHNVVFTITNIEEDTYVCGAYKAFWFDDQDKYELVPNKFDINTLKPFDKVLVRNHEKNEWQPNFFNKYCKEINSFKLIGVCTPAYANHEHFVNYCIPYEGNEHLLGTTDDCDEYFKTWK